mmetsp:Transcript_9580/g.11497  ORF Transcript_9580/g.11497 Transcript_9580/m.11497 type:complete len:701 (-) Transcript_9580:1379-3481(-)|eukprot:CAMPEP_0184028394 /NCGR_PEP_ID=MMETSP0954-20121128/14806_1 /TAXON_ID=627963 /ORGANISM="Aplanochytrium sp, Strain PBS07" /LENGTH=700 /DNA_ID=CAMNT_0026313213 /DNA_START=58 /DNA_END=2160 /DNA_ORIENTATION=+
MHLRLSSRSKTLRSLLLHRSTAKGLALSRAQGLSSMQVLNTWQETSKNGSNSFSFPRFFSTEANSNEKDGEEFEFQAETNQLLDIVTNSIYTDKEIFLRELVSNASDALEKLRHLQTSGSEIADGDKSLEIRIVCDEENKTLTIEDSGVGMTKEEMLQNLGTIAKSGSRGFRDDIDSSADAKANIIGQFGVGFYSAFMVGKNVEVYSKSATANDDSIHCWSSPGYGKFTLKVMDPEDANVKGLRGTKVVIHLSDESDEYSKPARIREIIKKYSNYVSFPIIVDDEQANKVTAIWARDSKEVSDEEYSEFYKFAAHDFQDPLYRVHFRADVPIDIKALVFVPPMNSEKLGMGRAKSGVSIYSRKVLLEHNSEKLLPGWLRFVKGVVDSEDLPISISRETMQDSRLLSTIGQVVTKRIIKSLISEAKKNPSEFNEKFALEFGPYIKEGVCSDPANQKDLAKLLRFGSSEMKPNELTSLDEYISRCDPSQDKIYYLSAPSKALAESSPYYEVFKSNNVEVLFLHSNIDDFALRALPEYEGRQLVSAESGQVDFDLKKADNEENESKLAPEEITALQEWIKLELPELVSEVRETNRLRDSPAIVIDHESASIRNLMRALQPNQDLENDTLKKQTLEINAAHPIIIGLNDLRKENTELARAVARQVFDNALIAAGLVDDPRDMLPRLNTLMGTLLNENLEKSKSK